MKQWFKRLLPQERKVISKERVIPAQPDETQRQINHLYDLYSRLIGPEQLVLRAAKLDALKLMNSTDGSDRILGLLRMLEQDPNRTVKPTPEELPIVIMEAENALVELLARKTIEERVERKVGERMEEKHQEYLRDIRMQVLKDEGEGDTPQSLAKLEALEKLENRKLTASVMERLRPAILSEIVGQEPAIAALTAKLASPYPQHLILYGPPGVGKTTAARLVLQAAREVDYSPFGEDAPFVEVDGTTLRWDPRDITNPLIGSVHDPIYQGARRDLAEGGVPEPKPGLVTEAHGGILFIDEIGEMDPMLQNKLLKVLEDKRVRFESAYYDPTDAHIPAYIRQLFDQGAPADFVLIAATTRSPEEISPALRSRAAEIFFEPLTPEQIAEIIRGAAKKLRVEMEERVPEIISEYTIEGRKATNLLADAYSLAVVRERKPEGVTITAEDVYRVAQVSRLTPYVSRKAGAHSEIGRVFGLGVAGFLGSVLEIEAIAFPAREKGKGTLRFNDTAGSMAKDSVFNAAAVVRRITGSDLSDYDIHVNIIGGGRIDGPSAGAAIVTAVLSAITDKPVRQDTAITGEISIQGKVKAVGGVLEKAYGARQAGVSRLIIPKENEKDITQGYLGLEIFPVQDIAEVQALLFENK